MSVAALLPHELAAFAIGIHHQFTDDLGTYFSGMWQAGRMLVNADEDFWQKVFGFGIIRHAPAQEGE